MKHLLWPFVAAAVLAACGAAGPVEGTGKEILLDDARIDESSGLARSHLDPQRLWTHNDGGDAAKVYAVDTQGHSLGSLALTLTANLDWEDMTSFVEDGRPRLLIADIGDNGAFRPFVTLHVVDEPEASGNASPFELSSRPARTFNVVYPDGPRDAESVAVDAQEGYVYILSKRDAVPQLYRVPLAPTLPVVTAESLGKINIERAPENAENPERINWTTSMDFDASGTRLVVIGLTRAHVYTRDAAESWQQALQHAPQTLDLPDYPQIEAVAWSADGEGFWITSEGAPAPLAYIPVPMSR